MNTSKITKIGAALLAVPLFLVGCTSAPSDEDPKTSEQGETTEEISEGHQAATDSVFAEEMPESLKESLGEFPEGWIFQDTGVVGTAMVGTYDPEFLKSFVATKLENGWTESMPSIEDEAGVIFSLINEKEQTLSVVGLAPNQVDAEGNEIPEASVITFVKETL